MIRLLVLLSLLSCSAKAVPTVTPEDTVVLSGTIHEDSIGPVIQALMLRSSEGRALTQLIIDSPGGSTISGFQLIGVIQVVRASGMRIECYVPTMAASMAFHILLHCDARYALDKALFLWHRARINTGEVALTFPQLTNLASDLAALDTLILDELVATLGIPREDVVFHLEAETLHLGRVLSQSTAPGFIEVYPVIPGLLQSLSASAYKGGPVPQRYGLEYICSPRVCHRRVLP